MLGDGGRSWVISTPRNVTARRLLEVAVALRRRGDALQSEQERGEPAGVRTAGSPGIRRSPSWPSGRLSRRSARSTTDASRPDRRRGKS